MPVSRFFISFPILILFALTLLGCQPSAVAEITPTATAASTSPNTPLPPPAVDLATNTPLPTHTATHTPTATSTPTPSHTPPPTTQPTPSATATIRILIVPTITPLPVPAACVQPDPATDNFIPLVTKTFGLSADYTPPHLVPLSDHFSNRITLGYPTMLRTEAIDPLKGLINDMESVGLSPFIISGYRSYNTQKIAFQKWQTIEPERAAQLSAPPGHSEHQLGLTVDFGSPNLQDYVETELTSNFHTNFYQTPEGQWLLNYAHVYGFTLSYPREAAALTGFFYEPWHYRYVGPELATQLHKIGISLTEYQLNQFDAPCEPIPAG